MVIIVHPGRYRDGRDHGAASQLDDGKSALLREAAHGFGADAAELAGRFVEVPQ
ncbi:MAG: hypothetical protein KDJ28_01395 [Candidatus Competibacteraceae bacterium]|nr:hypothetical protein [Candidatus Competibacteraceae bacterium]